MCWWEPPAIPRRESPTALDDAGAGDLGAGAEDEIRGRRGSDVVPAEDVRSDNDDDRHERR
ncbi:MAG: hypothetical protein ACMG5Z_05120 [Luteimonas sp.]